MIGAYRNAFAHDPVLGRAVSHRRELVPPASMLPKTQRGDDFLRWSETDKIPIDQMVDCVELIEGLWGILVRFLQASWGALANAFTTARTEDKFIMDLRLADFLPIRLALGDLTTANPFAASGTLIRP